MFDQMFQEPVGARFRQTLLDPRTLASLILLVAAAVLALEVALPSGVPFPALVTLTVTGLAAGYANSGST